MRPPRPPVRESVQHRDAAEAGITGGELRGPAWTHPVDGVALDASRAGDLDARCRAIQLILPVHAVWTHLTAALLRGWWLPAQVQLSVLMIVSMLDDAPHLERRGCYLRRVDVPPGHRTGRPDGLRISSVAWTIAELAEDLSLIDLVVVIDCALHLKQVTVTELWGVCIKGRRGVRTLRQAIRLADGRSESPWETILRLLLVLSGVVEVEPQVTVHDEDGRELGRADLRVGRTSRLLEYDGADHRRKARQASDLARDKRLTRAGWERFGYVDDEILRTPGRVVEDATDALGKPYDPSQLAVWHYEVERSSLSPAGRSRLARRLRRFVRTGPPRATRS